MSETEGFRHQYATINGLRYRYVREGGHWVYREEPELVAIADFVAS